MADKGGKGSPLSKGKQGLKTPTLESLNLKGKDAKSFRMGKTTQIESSDSDSDDSVEEISGSSKSGKRTPQPNTKTSKKVSFDNLNVGGKTKSGMSSGKGDPGKGGNVNKTGKSGGKEKPSAAKIITAVELKLEVDLPKDARILMDCEAAAVLQGIQDYLPILSEDPMIKIPESFAKALKYVQTVDCYTDPQGVTQALQKLKMFGVTDGELCMIANVCPETMEEAYALIPSLKRNKDENEGTIRAALAELAKLKRSV